MLDNTYNNAAPTPSHYISAATQQKHHRLVLRTDGPCHGDKPQCCRDRVRATNSTGLETCFLFMQKPDFNSEKASLILSLDDRKEHTPKEWE